MAWLPFNFFKYDPSTHDFDATTFNIKQALNNNWDHVKALIEDVREKVDGFGVDIDSAPTQGSQNAVSSGGVYNALAEKADSTTVEELQATLDGKASTESVNALNAAITKKGNTQTVRKTNVSIPVSVWISDSTYTDWPYKATLTISGVTAAMECKSITLDHTKPDLLYIFGPFVNTGANKLELWAASKPTTAITIENISFEEVLA